MIAARINDKRLTSLLLPRHTATGILMHLYSASNTKKVLAAALRANPRDPSTYVNLGVFHLQSADPAAAASYFAEALAIDPASVSARNGLAQSRAALGKP